LQTLTGDLLRAGLVASLARPGGNITGVSIFGAELDGKRLEILMEIVPGIRRDGRGDPPAMSQYGYDWRMRAATAAT
jgi:hypothetical protein